MPVTDQKTSCTRCCCTFIFTLGLTALFMWLSLRPSKPKCWIHGVYIPALNQSSNLTSNTTLFFRLELENTNKDKGVLYDPVNLTFFDGPNRTHAHLIGNFTIPGFRQGHKKTAWKPGQINNTRINTTAILRAISNGSAVFRVDMAASVRYNIIAWKTKRHRINVGAYVNMSEQGIQVNPKKGIRLSSRVGKIATNNYAQIGVLLINYYMIYGLRNL